MGIGLWYTRDPNFASLSLFWRCKEHPCPWSPDFWLMQTLGVPDFGFRSGSWFWYSWFELRAFNFDFEGAKNIHVLEVLIWDLEVPGGSWLGFGILILWGFWGHMRFLTGVWHLDHDLEMVNGLWYTFDPNFGSLSWFWRCKEHPCPLSPHLGLCRTLEVPDWGLASWSWFGYGHWSLVYPWSKI